MIAPVSAVGAGYSNPYAAAAYPPVAGGAASVPQNGMGGGVSGVSEPFKTEECQTCKNRRYQDGSSDPGVSFKAPGYISPEQSASMVASHEREHYSRNAAKAKEEGKEVVSNEIRLFSAVCPECGRVYVSGGETRTVTKQMQENEPFLKEFFDKSIGKHLTGKNMDEKK